MKKYFVAIVIFALISAAIYVVAHRIGLSNKEKEANLIFEDGVSYYKKGQVTFSQWKIRNDHGNFQKALDSFNQIIDSYPDTDVYETARYFIAGIHVYKNNQKAGKKILAGLNTEYAEKMHEFLDYLPYAWKTSIVNIDGNNDHAKELLDTIYNERKK